MVVSALDQMAPPDPFEKTSALLPVMLQRVTVNLQLAPLTLMAPPLPSAVLLEITQSLIVNLAPLVKETAPPEYPDKPPFSLTPEIVLSAVVANVNSRTDPLPVIVKSPEPGPVMV